MKKLVILFTLLLSICSISFAEEGYITYTIGNLSPWAESDVSEAIKEGLIKDNRLLEDANVYITREEFCETVVTLYEKITFDVKSDNFINPFSDTDNQSVIKAYHLGIVSGRGDSSFGPHLPIRREEMAVMIRNVINSLSISYESRDQPLTVEDQSAMATWSIDAIRFVSQQKFMTGDGRNFNPKNEITIEESVVILNRVYKDALSKTSDNTLEEKYYEALANQVIQLTNIEREKEGLKPLIAHETLQVVAIDKATDMVTLNYFDHHSPTYGSPFEMMKSYGIDYRAAAENIAFGQSSAEEVVTGWMNSPGHRANILNDSFSHIAIGVAENQDRRLYFVQLFLRPFE